LNLSKLIHEVWKDDRIRELRLRKDEVKILVEVLIDNIGKGLLKHGVVKLKNLLTLEVRKAKGRKIKNPQTGEHMYSNDYFKIGTRLSKKMREELNKSNK